MAHLVIIIIVGLSVVAATIGMMWSQWLENRRQMAAIEVIRQALERGQEPPSELYKDLQPLKETEKTTPLGAAVVFGAIAVGFGAGAYLSWRGSGAAVVPFSVVAGVMGLMAVVSLIVALYQSLRKAKP